ncbi:MAG: hypothetical protein UT05_C0006G0046 [Parcubacteria group bacterium GW2011_GWF2_38_76]|nr:MAG: hypothetical protein UT05_C0006G0046 [Parcubacteria group bacterium GW2011_GWF2_38_76]HBM45855.1 hypothetical protein [Patescibacteria group bacterium]
MLPNDERSKIASAFGLASEICLFASGVFLLGAILIDQDISGLLSVAFFSLFCIISLAKNNIEATNEFRKRTRSLKNEDDKKIQN